MPDLEDRIREVREKLKAGHGLDPTEMFVVTLDIIGTGIRNGDVMVAQLAGVVKDTIVTQAATTALLIQKGVITPDEIQDAKVSVLPEIDKMKAKLQAELDQKLSQME